MTEINNAVTPFTEAENRISASEDTLEVQQRKQNDNLLGKS